MDHLLTLQHAHIYIYIHVLLGACLNPNFAWSLTNAAKTQREMKKLKNGTAKSVTHPHNKVVFSAFSGFALLGGPVASSKKTVFGSAFCPGEIWLFNFPTHSIRGFLGFGCS